MANGEQTQAFILSITDAAVGAFKNSVSGHVAAVEQTAKTAVLIDQIERIAMVIIIVGAVWYIAKKNR